MRFVLVFVSLFSCTQTPCADGFGRTADGMCFPIADGNNRDSMTVDSADSFETGESGSSGTRPLFDEGAFAGANVIAISIDTMPAWAVEFMPDLSAILGEGVELSRHGCGAVWTPPCMDSFALGTPAPEIGVDVFQPDTQAGNAVIDDTYVTFAETMAADGYATGLVTGNSFFGSTSNTQQGYAIEKSEGTLSEGVEKFRSMVADMQDGGGPWYAHYHVMGPHDPYIDSDQPASYYACLDDIDGVPEGFDWADGMITFTIEESWTTWSSDQQRAILQGLACVYAGQLAWIDDMVFSQAGLWGQLERQGAFNNTLVVLFSDHGEEFGERAEYGQPYFGHNRSTYVQVGGVLGAFWAPDIEPDVITAATDHGDLAPTVLSTLGIDVPEGFGGIPVGEIGEGRIVTRYRCGGPRGTPATQGYAARTSTMSLHLRETGAWEAYSLSSDPEELVPLAERDPDLEAAVLDVQARAAGERWCGN